MTASQSCESAVSTEVLREIFQQSYSELAFGIFTPSVRVEFYPFVGVNHTIRFNKGHLLIRVSDLFTEAPREVLKALSVILICKLFRRQVPSLASSTYRDYVNSFEIRHKLEETRAVRGRKRMLDPRGDHFDLGQLFARLNQEYFDDRLNDVVLGWSSRRSRRILGHFDPSHHSITISRLLDSWSVPEFVVSYVLFHEMLHARFSRSSNFDLKHRHSPQFKEEERKYRAYAEANEWLKNHL
ncbi:MAG: SprT-like domain-containing protein [Acidobacteriota bacterium]